MYELREAYLKPLSKDYRESFGKDYPYPESFLGFALDINEDKKPEYFIKNSAVNSCKECWFIMSGETGEEIAYFNGKAEISVTSGAINGFPVFEVSSTLDNSLKVYVFNGNKYQLVSCVEVSKGSPSSCFTVGSPREPIQTLNKSSKRDAASGAPS